MRSRILSILGFVIVGFVITTFFLEGETINVAIGAIFKEEDDYLLEWIEYHSLIGVQKFYLFSNDCHPDPSTTSLLKTYASLNIVHLSTEFSCSTSAQHLAYDSAVSLAAADNVDWIALVDIDEFIHVRDPTKSIANIMSMYTNKYNAVGLLWRVFGSNNHVKKPETKPIVLLTHDDTYVRPFFLKILLER
ncbi:hypothetical protein TrST_g10522 [Triparma strigata]|uniref:Glycosyltransferase family 92 protein n=1 Tax=Triparma strigata TaxID=1606541 RepID=A0A9W6ZK71_9STRA|nr:hypothetical protein TrST_g10522 [Triparma strigata]